MSKLLLGGVLALCALFSMPAVHAAPSNPAVDSQRGSDGTSTIPGGRYGNVVLVKPIGPEQAFVVLFSESTGWSTDDQQAALALAQRGAMVIGVDSARYAKNLAAINETCHPLVGDAENMSHQLEREQQLSRYMAPILAGRGQGGLMAERMLAQAPANTVAGAITIDPDKAMDPRFNLCPPDATISRGVGVPGFLELAYTVATPTVDTVQSHRPRVPEMPILALGRPVIPHDVAPGESFAQAISRLAYPHLAVTPHTEHDVSDLPLIELRGAADNDRLAIVISGDGGWRDLDKSVAEDLQKQGVSVVGLDSLRYFWSLKSPSQSTADLTRIIETYSVRWHTRHIALIGYSFGADVMPFLYNRLAPEWRRQVSSIALLGLAPAADFQIRVGGWLGLPPSSAALPVGPELAKLPVRLVQCVYGSAERDTVCPSLAKTGVAVIRIDGDHHFGGSYDSLTSTLLAGWQKQIAARD
jgi:type IV secretory pathway VirJ component